MSILAFSVITVSLVALPDMEVAPKDSPAAMNAEFSRPAPAVWMTDYEGAAKLAAQNGLPLLLHFDATWCGACRRMDSEVLNRREVKDYLGSSVIGCRIDADRRKDLIAKFGISTLPTEIVVHSDGTQGNRYVGAVSLSLYESRLNRISQKNRALVASSKASGKAKASEKSADIERDETEAAAAQTRSCLIVKHDGKMVGMGGFSPVALTSLRQWKKGSENFVATHEGVCYFFQNSTELARFRGNPERFIPSLHGCDPVTLFTENRATPGAIEYGAFYDGRVFFFANLQNRNRFESNPKWYVSIEADAMTQKDPGLEFLKDTTSDN